jgi:hypothetical protein
VIISSRFEDVDFRAFSWFALVTSSPLFGLSHARWPAAAFAGVIYALLMWRGGRLPSSIAAHMTSNAVMAGLLRLVSGRFCNVDSKSQLLAPPTAVVTPYATPKMGEKPRVILAANAPRHDSERVSDWYPMSV